MTPDLTATVDRIATRATRLRPDDRDDAVQEGLAAAWLLGPDASIGLQVRVAQRAILSFVAGRPSVLARGEGRRFVPTPALPLDAPNDDGERRSDYAAERLRLHVQDHADAVALRLDVEAALQLLSPADRQLARAVMTHGNPTRAAEVLGRKPNSARAAWLRRIRPTLQGALA